MAETKDNSSERHDSGGNVLNWTNPIHGFLKINGVPISTPSNAAMKSLARPLKESLDVSWQYEESSETFPCTHITLSARGFEGMRDEYVGRVSILIHITLKFRIVQVSVRPGALNELIAMGKDGLRLRNQLKSLRQTVGKDKHTDKQIDLYFPPEAASAVADVARSIVPGPIVPSAARPPRKGIPVCFACKEAEHRASECPKFKAARTGRCRQCGVDGHKWKDYPERV
ncbi:hypothetical protein NCS52_00542700 [Fusarium sp. LHS14.1]|nr:hypothetical protein NCS52_00542700 [Fusarium sp. LHS14.1]